MSLVIALAGRRVDAADAGESRFPLGNTALVGERLRAFFAERQATTLVSSAACGADLVALEVAERLGMRRRVVLPFAPERFRETSVVDRPGDWGPFYDRTIAETRRVGDLVVLEQVSDPGSAYEAANESILREAILLAGDGVTVGLVPPKAALALIVWEGRSRGADDATNQFAEAARAKGMTVEEVLTR